MDDVAQLGTEIPPRDNFYEAQGWNWEIYKDYEKCEDTNKPDIYLAIGDGYDSYKYDITLWDGEFRVYKHDTYIFILFYNEFGPHRLFAAISLCPEERDYDKV
jgi:hypothetical protein